MSKAIAELIKLSKRGVGVGESIWGAMNALGISSGIENDLIDMSDHDLSIALRRFADIVECAHCGGHGVVACGFDMGPSECSECHGTGKLP